MALPLLGIIARLAMSAPAVGRAVAGVAARSAARGLSATGATLARLGATVGASSIASGIANRITEATANTTQQSQQETQSDTPAEEQAIALEAQPQETSVEKIGAASDGEIGSKLVESPVINLLRSINENQRELVNTLKSENRASRVGSISAALRQAKPTQVEQAGLGGSLALLLGAAIAGGFTEMTSRFSQFINGVSEAVQTGITSALSSLSESISNFFNDLLRYTGRSSEEQEDEQRRYRELSPGRGGQGAGSPGQNWRRMSQASRGGPDDEQEVEDALDILSTPEPNETAEMRAQRLAALQEIQNTPAGERITVTPAARSYLESRNTRLEEINSTNEATGGEIQSPAEMTPDQNAAIERAFRSAETAQASAAAAAAQQNPQRVVPGSEEDLRLQEQADREEATQRGRSQSSPGWFSRFVNTLTGRDAQLQQRSDTFVRGNRSLAAGMDEEMRSLSNIIDTSEEARDRMSQTINNSGGAAQPNVIINQTAPQTQQEPNIIPAPQASQSMSTPGSRTAAVSLGSYPRLLNQSPAFAG